VYSSSTTLSASNVKDREDPSGGSTQRNAIVELRSHHPPVLHKYDFFSCQEISSTMPCR